MPDWVSDPYMEWAPLDWTENSSTHYLASAITDADADWVAIFDWASNPPTPPSPKKVHPPSGPPPTGHPTPPRVRRPRPPAAPEIVWDV